MKWTLAKMGGQGRIDLSEVCTSLSECLIPGSTDEKG